MARIEPLAPGDWPPEMRDALAALRPAGAKLPAPRREGRPKGLNALGTFARYPALAQAWHTFNGHVLFATSLSERQRELAVLRVATLRKSEYEWRQHAVLAGDAGISAEEVARVEEGPAADGWADGDRELLRAVDELVTDAVISDDTWNELAGTLDTHQLMDLVFTVGAYDLLAMAFRSFGVEVDADLAAHDR